MVDIVKPILVCSIGPDYNSIQDYFRSIGNLPAQIREKAIEEAGSLKTRLLSTAASTSKKIRSFLDKITTPVFNTIVNLEHEMNYRARELIKDINFFFQKKIIECITKIISGLVDIINVPIPFLEGVRIFDFFTIEGKKRIKAAIRQNLKEVIEAIQTFDSKVTKFFNGVFNTKIPDYSVEEIWHSVLLWGNRVINDWIHSAIEAVRNLPVIKQVLGVLAILQDPTLALQKAVDVIWDRALEIVADNAAAAMDTVIEFITNFGLPIIGTVGVLLNLKEEAKRSKVHIKELILARVHDAWLQAIEEIRKILALNWLSVLYSKLLGLVGSVLEEFPILKDIIAALALIVGILTGKITACDVINLIAQPLFALVDEIFSSIPSYIENKTAMAISKIV